METLIKKSETNVLFRTLKHYTMLFIFIAFFAVSSFANYESSNSAVSTKAAESSTTLAAAQKDAEKQNTMNYVYMVVGIIVIIGIAWFASTGKKKSGGAQPIERSPISKYRPSGNDKKYGTSRSRA